MRLKNPVWMQTNWSMSYGSALASTLKVHIVVKAGFFFSFTTCLVPTGIIHIFPREQIKYTNNKSLSVLKTSAEVDASNNFLLLKRMWKCTRPSFSPTQARFHTSRDLKSFPIISESCADGCL